MSEEFQVDYDAEAVWLDDGWYGREDLARRIKEMIEGGDYRIARPSSALEKLEAALGAARVLAVRVPTDLAEATEQLAERAGRPTSAILREALAYYVGAQGEAPKAEPPPPPAEAAVAVTEEQVVVIGEESGDHQAWFGK